MKITGDVPEIKRFQTGMWSFDHAFEDDDGEIGLPIGIVIEIFGYTGCGKSTITYGLAGRLAKYMDGNIAVIDYEEFNKKHLVKIMTDAKFDGELNYINEETDEDMVNKLLSVMKTKTYKVGFIDGVGAISPISEQEGDVGEANMGRRAKILAQLSRKSRKIRRDSDMTKTIFMTNHLHPVMGGRGVISPGGLTKDFMSKVRIRAKRKEDFRDGSYVIEGTVIKNSFGYEKRKFYLFVLAGRGIHEGLTWFYDAFMQKIVTRGKSVKMDGKSIGYIGTIIAEGYKGNDEFFTPFRDALANIEPSRDEVSTDEGQPESDEDTDNPSDGDQ